MRELRTEKAEALSQVEGRKRSDTSCEALRGVPDGKDGAANRAVRPVLARRGLRRALCPNCRRR
jgi:hypothetical protein